MTQDTTGRIVRWGLPDFVIAWLAGVLVGSFAAVPVAPAAHAPRRDQVAEVVVALFVQSAVSILVALWISRAKGRGSLTRDFGLEWDWRATTWIIWGAVIAVVTSAALSPLTSLLPHNDRSQDVVDTFKASNGVGLALFVVGVLVLAPVTEELLFRGVLLRSLLRRIPATAAILVSALVFALVHPLLDPTLGTLVAVPALFALGAISAYQAVHTGSLARSIALHVGFNLVTVLSVLAKL
ncbi:MAG TPA: CPBP family intramembrane glutamic endopeptidase [Acidimicrobiia bacterium]